MRRENTITTLQGTRRLVKERRNLCSGLPDKACRENSKSMDYGVKFRIQWNMTDTKNNTYLYNRRNSQGGVGLFSRHNPSLSSLALISLLLMPIGINNKELSKNLALLIRKLLVIWYTSCDG